jgi:uncharacterized protein YjbI with pentapeptide repeats
MKVTLPKIPAGLRETSNDPTSFKREAYFERIILRGFEALNRAAQKMKFDEVALDRLVLINAALDNVTMLDVEVRGCDLSATVLASGNCNRVRFTSCRMAGADLSRTTLKNVTFVGCKLDMANFRFAKLQGVVFEDCELNEADFQMAELREVTFTNCTIERGIFTQCTISNVDARGSELRGIHGWRYLRGLVIDHTQLITIAPELARDLGLKIQ